MDLSLTLGPIKDLGAVWKQHVLVGVHRLDYRTPGKGVPTWTARDYVKLEEIQLTPLGFATKQLQSDFLCAQQADI